MLLKTGLQASRVLKSGFYRVEARRGDLVFDKIRVPGAKLSESVSQTEEKSQQEESTSFIQVSYATRTASTRPPAGYGTRSVPPQGSDPEIEDSRRVYAAEGSVIMV